MERQAIITINNKRYLLSKEKNDCFDITDYDGQEIEHSEELKIEFEQKIENSKFLNSTIKFLLSW